MNEEFLEVKIITPKQVIYQGPALSVSSTNSAGRFDILPEHANFITLVVNQEIQIQNTSHQFQAYKFSQAIIYNFRNKVSIYAEPLLN